MMIPVSIKEYNLPKDEICALSLNINGIRAEEFAYKRLRLFLRTTSNTHLFFSVENNHESPFVYKNGGLFYKDSYLYDVSEVCEDSCDIFYTRKEGSVLCFNPNNRSVCKGCSFCYQPKSNDERTISSDMIFSAFQEWMNDNNIIDLSHLEQVAIVTGCFPNEDFIVDYLFKLREVLLPLGFSKEILFFGMISDVKNLEKLSQIKPIKICFTVECFERRDKIIKKSKALPLDDILSLMNYSKKIGINTTFSYIIGLDTLPTLESWMVKFMDEISSFPIISLFQTDARRRLLRTSGANELEYYLEARKLLENMFERTPLKPDYWSNYRSLWRTCYGKSNESILP